MFDVFIDSLLDSIKILAFIFIFNIVFSFFEVSLTRYLSKNKKTNPVVGSVFGLLPQCGVSVVSADLYIKKHISMGTIVAIFITCSDEALPIMLASFEWVSVIHLLLLKIVIGIIVGLLVDLINNKSKEKVHKHLHKCKHEEEVKIGCCNHEINNEKGSKIKNHLLHPLFHSLKLFAYFFIITFLFGTIIYYIGSDKFELILQNNKYFTPVYATMIGLIPNCASSIIITNMYVSGKLSFGSTLSGLIANAGLGLLVLLKNKNMIKKTMVIIGILVLTALVSGYIINLIFGF